MCGVAVIVAICVERWNLEARARGASARCYTMNCEVALRGARSESERAPDVSCGARARRESARLVRARSASARDNLALGRALGGRARAILKRLGMLGHMVWWLSLWCVAVSIGAGGCCGGCVCKGNH